MFRSQAAIVGLCLLVSTGKLVAAPREDSGGTDHYEIRLDAAYQAAHHGRYSAAIAIVNDVIASSPDFASAYLFRATANIDIGRLAEADQDLDIVQEMHPDYAGVYFFKAEIALFRHLPALALKELADGSKLPPNSMWKRSRRYDTTHTVSYWYSLTSIAEQMLGHDDAAVQALANELKFETERPWYVLNAHCHVAGVAGLLGMAELTCDEAIEKQDHDTGAYDSRGLVHLKMKKWDAAIADYDKSLHVRPDLTLSLYGRGVARRATGDRMGGDADIAAAQHDEPDIANIMARLGVHPT